MLFNDNEAFISKPNFDIKHKQVLVVVYNTFTNLLFVEQLKVFGIECDVAYNGSTALEFLNSQLQGN